MGQNVKVQTIHSVDLMKFIFSICIVILHGGGYMYLPGAYYIEKLVLRQAVPFFFVVSGFFLGQRNISENPNYVKKYIKRLGFPLIVFLSINTVLEITKMILSGDAVESIAVDVLKHVFFYQYGALWHLSASIFGLLFLLPFVKRGWLNFALVLGTILYGFALLCNNYYFLVVEQFPFLESIISNYMNIFISARNGLFVGFLFLGLGMKTYDIANKAISNKRLYAVFLISLVGYLLEAVMLRNKVYLDDGALFIFHLVLIPSFLCVLLKIQISVSDEISLLARNLSTGIYLLHRTVLSLIAILVSVAGVSILPPISCLITLFICIAVCMGVYKTKKEPLYTLLR